MKVVVDTNVPVVANGLNNHASLDCQERCVDFLSKVMAKNGRSRIAVDSSGLIFDEYRRHLSFSGQPGIGDVFFKFVHDNMHLPKKIELVTIAPIADVSRGFEELPVNDFDKSDRKFLAVAVSAGARIVNAVDTDWHQGKALIDGLGVDVVQICPEHGCVV